MRKLNLLVAILCTGIFSQPALAQPANVDPAQWLLEQVRLGEALYRDELLRDALGRLYKISPYNILGLEAEVRLAVRHGNLDEARRLLEEIRRRAPDSAAFQRAQLLIALQEPDKRQALQQARLLASAGRVDEAVAAYDAVLGGVYPTLDLAIEYWRLYSRKPDGNGPALKALLELDKDYPRNTPLRQTLVNLLLAEDREEEALKILHALAEEPLARNAAAQRELEFLSGEPATDETGRRWKDFLAIYEGTPVYSTALELQAQLQRLLDDPAWQAGRQGLALLEQDKNTQAEPLLKRALQAYPHDAELLGGLGLVYMRTNRRQQALNYFEQALENEQNAFRTDKWIDLIASARFWLVLDQAEAAVARGDWLQAQRLYQQAQRQDPESVEPILGLGNAAKALGQRESAERYYIQARRMDPNGGRAIRGLVNLYEEESPEKVIAFLDSLPPAARQPFLGLRNRLEVDQLTEQAKLAAEGGYPAQATHLLTRARQLTPDDPWLTYRLASTYQGMGEPQLAEQVFNDLLQKQGQNPTARYAHALFLSSRDQYANAIESLRAVPMSAWDDDMRALAARLERQQHLAYADSLRAAGQEGEAIAFLKRQPPHDAIDSRLADWAQQRGDYAEAHLAYERILARNPADPDARLGKIEVWIAEGRLDQAREALQSQTSLRAMDESAGLSVNQRRRVANALAATGDLAQARAIMYRLTSAQTGPDALLFRDAARLVRDEDPQLALNTYARAMRDNGLLGNDEMAIRGDAFTRATRAESSDDWLRRSIRQDVETLYQRENPTITVQNDLWGDDGTPGYSELTANTTMLQAEVPYKAGRAFFRVEHVFLNAGRFETDADNTYDPAFGTCTLQACSGSRTQRVNGTGLAIGWRNDKIEADIGVTPLGFKVVDVVGGVTYSGDFKSVGWSLSASRRPMSNSLLSYAGTRDPNTGITWGGVRATGVNLGLSWDQGGANGFWANLGYARLTGKNVESNQRYRLMAGYYRRLIDTPKHSLTAGLTGMVWHYSKDLGGYTLGQGGYYSPQRYYSLSVPLRYTWRNENWSYALGGSVSWSRAQTDSSPDYPLRRLLRGVQAAGIDDASSSGSSSGFGYTLLAQVERRLTRHVVVGAGVDIQRSNDYAPSRAMLYLRYTFEPWSGNLPMPVQRLVPYGDF